MQEEFVLFARQSDKSKFELEQALAELTTTYKKIISENLG
jgi:type I restriction enzyme S subunit